MATTGTIKRLISEKGFGFIKAESGTEYFFHRHACGDQWDSLQEGQRVTFDPSDGPKGPRAENVQFAYGIKQIASRMETSRWKGGVYLQCPQCNWKTNRIAKECLCDQDPCRCRLGIGFGLCNYCGDVPLVRATNTREDKRYLKASAELRKDADR